MLVRCLYASRAAVPTDGQALQSILAQSRRNNPKFGITGLLVFSNGHFIQVLEGGRQDVCRLFSRIVGDARNTGVEILSFKEIAERRFGNWNMGQASMASLNPALLLKYSERAELDPFKCGGEATMALLFEIAEAGAVANCAS